MNATTTTNMNGSIAADLNAALDHAIAALTSLDADRLEQIEGEMSLATANRPQLAATPAELQEIIARHRLLGSLLASTSLNLNFLQRLHSRNSLGETSWVR